VKNGQIEFVSLEGVEGFDQDMTFKGQLEGGWLVGTVTGSKGASWRWVATKAPAMTSRTMPKWGKPITLFNGKDFTGWRFWRSDARFPRDTWTIEDGTLVSNGESSDIVTTAKFDDFKLHIEFNCGDKSNSGVYLRGRYELQIETESESEPPSHHTGGIYGFIDPTPEQPRRPGVWQTYDITLVGRMLTVVQNGVTVIDHREIPGITGGAIDSDEGQPGPLFLQGREVGRVAFRNIVLTPAVK
jgi:hypothetical protein